MMAAGRIDARAFVRHDESMAAHTSWRVGGPADIYCEPRTEDELVSFLRELPATVPLVWVGYGSNLLVRDGGIRGAVVATARMQRQLERLGDTRVRVGAGVAGARLAKQCEQWGLRSAAFMAGIPGTLGGALAMNAGAFGGETWTYVDSVRMIDRSGQIRERPRSDFRIDYRSVVGPSQEWFLSATLQLDKPEPARDSAIRSLLERRAATQPLGQPSCGSVFRNPPDGYAGELIESCGLKGARIGGAVVSEKHANFIVNDGSASAADIEALIEHVRARVAEQTGVELRAEVRIVGEAAPPRPGSEVSDAR